MSSLALLKGLVFFDKIRHNIFLTKFSKTPGAAATGVSILTWVGSDQKKYGKILLIDPSWTRSFSDPYRMPTFFIAIQMRFKN